LGLAYPPGYSRHLASLEGCFSVVTRKALTNTIFTSTGQLEAAVDVWVSHWSDEPQPFVWTRPSTTSSPRSSADEPPSIASLNRRRTTSGISFASRCRAFTAKQSPAFSHQFSSAYGLSIWRRQICAFSAVVSRQRSAASSHSACTISSWCSMIDRACGASSR
jgi:hypothetical protein